MNAYRLVDSGSGRKLEQFGPYRIVRPCAAAIWRPRKPPEEWQAADATFSRADGNRWTFRNRLPETWTITLQGLTLKVGPTPSGHMGVFPEHGRVWIWFERFVLVRSEESSAPAPTMLNLFGYSGGATLAAVRAGARVCHVDASRTIIARARENAALNQIGQDGVRWINDDVEEFLGREERRGKRYDAILLDPPSFGRGSHQEIFKIEHDLPGLLAACRRLLSNRPLGWVLTCHTPGYTPLLVANLLREATEGLGGAIDHGELLLPGGDGTYPLPSGVFARWTPAR